MMTIFSLIGTCSSTIDFYKMQERHDSPTPGLIYVQMDKKNDTNIMKTYLRQYPKKIWGKSDRSFIFLGQLLLCNARK